MSEPLAFVPFEYIISFGNQQSPACAYDDPRLFEDRGNAVSPGRKDFTGISICSNKWRWGDEECRANVTMHNEMSKRFAHGVRASRRVGKESLALRGANGLLAPDILRVRNIYISAGHPNLQV